MEGGVLVGVDWGGEGFDVGGAGLGLQDVEVDFVAEFAGEGEEHGRWG